MKPVSTSCSWRPRVAREGPGAAAPYFFSLKSRRVFLDLDPTASQKEERTDEKTKNLQFLRVAVVLQPHEPAQWITPGRIIKVIAPDAKTKGKALPDQHEKTSASREVKGRNWWSGAECFLFKPCLFVHDLDQQAWKKG